MGKSTLKYLLVHNTPKAVKTSTAVMATPESLSHPSSTQWREAPLHGSWSAMMSWGNPYGHASLPGHLMINTKYPSEAEVSRREQAEQEYSSLEQGDTLPLVLSAQDIPVHHQQCSNSSQTQVGTIQVFLAQVSLSLYLTPNTPNCFRIREGMERESSC